MKFFADFHIHSRHTRGAHPGMDLPAVALWAKYKGLGLVGTGDFLHPQWLADLKKNLNPTPGRGIYEFEGAKFVLSAEVSCAGTLAGKKLDIHHLVFAPHFAAAEKLAELLKRHGDLSVDGLPALSLTPRELLEAAAEASGECLVVPAHSFGAAQALFSSQFGYNLLLDVYGDAAKYVRVLETGPAVDPALARRWSALDGLALMSNSGARRPAELGREANVFDCGFEYKEILTALVQRDGSKFLGTLESYSEQDAYFASGHKACQWRKSGKAAETCWVCGRPPEAGVADRIEAAADRSAKDAAERAENFVRVVPLLGILSDVLGFQPEAESVQKQYLSIVTRHGPELEVLLDWEPDRLNQELPPRVAERILAARRGHVKIEPGYDGVPGRVRVMPGISGDDHPDQLRLFK